MKPVCVAIIDVANARLYSYAGDPPVFREIRDLLNPGRRGRDRDLFSTTKPGLTGGRLGRRANLTDDHREANRAEWDREFAKDIVAACHEVARVRGVQQFIFVSTPRMLGELRKVSEPLRRTGIRIDELQRDLGGMTSTQIHDRLADLHLIDRRPRAR